jgi:hypothetical protein
MPTSGPADPAMRAEKPRCPRCDCRYAWGTTVCPRCHVGLELFDATAAPRQTTVFETADPLSSELVAGLLEAHGIPCRILGGGDIAHGGLGLRFVCVPAEQEAAAQAILDAEIGREPEAG